MAKRFWTIEEINYLKLTYSDCTTDAIAKSLGRTLSQVYNAANKLGLYKSEAYHKAEMERQAIRLKAFGSDYRFKKGQIPINKGVKISPELYEKLSKTMWKKGNEPCNTKYDGHIRISKEGYKEIRIRKGKYRLLHIVEWEKVNGPLPKGHCLRNRNGNKLNTDPDNWELITRSENMKLNTIHRFPDSIKSTIKLLSKLKHQINEKQDRRP
jgi:mRNA-degrading endonuclease RelE of RelBE toxin-antitoxin system